MQADRRFLLAAAALSALLPAVARAQAWPSKPLRIVHGYDPGSNPDTVSRLLAPGLTERLGQPVLVEARPGAAGRLAARYVAGLGGEGTTLLMLTAGDPVVAALDPKVPFRLLEDFTGVSSVIEFPFVLCVAEGSPLKSLGDLLEQARRRPGQLSYGTPGVGTTQSMTGELLQKTAGVELLHVPYKGNAFADLLAGRVDFLVAAPSVTVPLIKGGKVRALAVTSREAYGLLPDVPTVQRTLPGFEVASWLGLAVPRATPEAIVRQLSGAVQAVLGADSVRASIAAAGSLPAPGSPEALRARIESDVRKWSAFAGRVKLDS